MAETVIMPKLGFDMAEGTLVRWVITEGEPVTKGAVLAEIETDKATVEVESAYEGIVAKHLVSQGAVVPVNTPIAIITAPGEAVELGDRGTDEKREGEKKKEPAAAPEPPQPVTLTSPAAPLASTPYPLSIKASPLARRIAKEKGFDLNQIKSSGPGGRVIKSDVEAFKPASLASSTASAQPYGTAPDLSSPTPARTFPLNRLRIAIGRRMTEAKQQIPHFYVTHEYDMAGVLSLRKQINALLPEDEKISVNDFIVKAAALNLRQYPNLNASLQGDQVVQHGAVHVGVAVALEGGLLTVVCHNADSKPLRQIAAELKSMVARARDGKVRPEDIEGSTFSISNLGMYEVEQFSAIINPPEAAILAVGSAREVPVIQEGAVVPGIRMKATISVDHRVSDGVEAAQFMQTLAKFLEEPMRLLV